MKTATYKAEILSADFEENTITFLIDGDFKVRAGKYFIFSKEDLQNFADRLCEKQRKNCLKRVSGEFNCINVEHAEQPKIEEL